MKNFMIFFFGPAPEKEKMDEAMQAWGVWMEEHKNEIVDMGGPFSEAVVIESGEARPMEEMSGPIGQMRIKADSMNAAISLMKTSPSAMEGKKMVIKEIASWMK